MFAFYMANSKRRKGQQYTRQVRASIKAFLRRVEFAPYAEIYAHVRADDTLIQLSLKERVRVAYTTLKAPVFICFKTANVVGDTNYRRRQTLWRVNEDYEEFNPFKKD